MFFKSVKMSWQHNVWRMAVAKNENGEICWPDIYMDGECLKVQEKTL